MNNCNEVLEMSAVNKFCIHILPKIKSICDDDLRTKLNVIEQKFETQRDVTPEEIIALVTSRSFGFEVLIVANFHLRALISSEECTILNFDIEKIFFDKSK